MALGIETSELAEQGNADARQAVNEMRAQGIELRAPAAPAPSPAP